MSMLPIKSSSSFPMSTGMSTGAIVGTLPDVINSITAIVDSCNNRDIRIHEITKLAEIENNKINKDYLDKCNQWTFKSRVMHEVFLSDKFSGDQIISLAKECLK